MEDNLDKASRVPDIGNSRKNIGLAKREQHQCELSEPLSGLFVNIADTGASDIQGQFADTGADIQGQYADTGASDIQGG
jgi:hypothetical protein